MAVLAPVRAMHGPAMVETSRVGVARAALAALVNGPPARVVLPARTPERHGGDLVGGAVIGAAARASAWRRSTR